jgi:hypothetical protein
MNRCRSCNGILTNTERNCFSCGEAVAKPESAGIGMSILGLMATLHRGKPPDKKLEVRC